MTPTLSYFYLARFVLEAETAFALSTGLADASFDNSILRDVNHLPALSGSSLAGVLRHRFQAEVADEEKVNKVFGFADLKQGDASKQPDGQASHLHLSWGYLHDSNNRAIETRLDPDTLKADPFLERLTQAHLIHRERVALNDRGVAKSTMKFDVTLAPAGCRFSVEMSLWSDQSDDPEWKCLLALLQTPLHIGAATRSGLGHFFLQQLHQGCFNLTQTDDYQRFSELSQTAIDDTNHLCKVDIDEEQHSAIELNLEAEDFWRFGQTGAPLLDSSKTPDAVPLSEVIIEWSKYTVEQNGCFSPRKIVIPGSGVKGALAQRCAFHYRRLTQDFTPLTASERDAEQQTTRTQAHPLADFLGYAADTEQEQSLGLAGLLFFRDVYLTPESDQLSHLMHTSIDRFTGGVRDGALFMEEMIWKNPANLRLKIDIDWQRLAQLQANAATDGKQQHYQTLFHALHLTLNDLCQGRLALGAGASKGYGYFSGTARYSAKTKEWMEKQQ